MKNLGCVGKAALLLLAFGLGASGPSTAHGTTGNVVNGILEGDLVQVQVTATVEGGAILFATGKDVAERPKEPDFFTPAPIGPEAVVAGKESRIPGLAQAVVGMVDGEKRQLTVAAETAFGKPDPDLRKEFPCERTVAKTLRLPAEQYLRLAGAFPQAGQEVPLIPYLRCRVAKVEESAVVLEFSADDGQQINEDFGTVVINVQKDKITTRLRPKLGAAFVLENKPGRIVSSDGNTFTVDFNSPRQGHRLLLDLEIVSHVPAQVFADREITWESTFDKGMELAGREGKPAILVLYADWCPWCKRLFGESLADVRVKSTYDRFVWMKINSDIEKQFKEKFGQKNFPMIVLFSPDGKVLNKSEGFLDGGTFYRNLKTFSGIL